MKTHFLPVALAAVVLAFSACGGNGTPPQSEGPISEDRTAAFKSMAPEFTRMGKMVKNEGPYGAEKFKQTAATFAGNSKKPFILFKSGPQGNGRTLPAIWADAATFEAEEGRFVAAVEKLNAAAQAGKLEEIKAAYGGTDATCKSCHDTSRGPE